MIKGFHHKSDERKREMGRIILVVSTKGCFFIVLISQITTVCKRCRDCRYRIDLVCRGGKVVRMFLEKMEHVLKSDCHLKEEAEVKLGEA